MIVDTYVDIFIIDISKVDLLFEVNFVIIYR